MWKAEKMEGVADTAQVEVHVGLGQWVPCPRKPGGGALLWCPFHKIGEGETVTLDSVYLACTLAFWGPCHFSGCPMPRESICLVTSLCLAQTYLVPWFGSHFIDYNKYLCPFSHVILIILCEVDKSGMINPILHRQKLSLRNMVTQPRLCN